MALTKAWTLLAQSDLMAGYLVSDQVNRLTELNSEATDPFGAVMPDVVNEVRTAIASNPANTLSATALAVPPELKRTTAWLVVEALAVQFSNGAPLTPIQTDQVKEAKATLDRVRNWKLEQRNTNGGGFYISQPSDPEVGASQSARPTAVAVDTGDPFQLSGIRECTRTTLQGL